jgi:hypothetical protein
VESQPFGAGRTSNLGHQDAGAGARKKSGPREEERAAGNEDTFFTLVYNVQHAPAHEWFGSRGWWALATPLPFQLRSLGRPVPASDTEAGFMTGNISLVSAIKD